MSRARVGSLLARLARVGPSLTQQASNLLPTVPAAAHALGDSLMPATFVSNQQLWRSFHASSLASDVDVHNEDAWYQTIQYPPPEVAVAQPAPSFKGTAVVDGEFKTISLNDYKGKYVVLFFYPKDFTFVCPTEIIAFSDRAKEFEKLNCQLIAASTDTEESHLAWMRLPRKKGGLGHIEIPVLADTTKEIAARYGVLLEDKGIALRGLFVINPQGVVEHITINNLPIGRSVDEVLRVLQAIQFVAEHGEVCPANWKPGAKTMVADPEKSLDYFSTVQDSEQAFATKLTPISDRKGFDAAMAASHKTPVVIDFYAPWCGKCKQIGPFVDELVDKYPCVNFMKVDTTGEQTEQLSMDLGIKALPAFRFFKGGKEVSPEITGYKKRPLEDAVKALSG